MKTYYIKIIVIVDEILHRLDIFENGLGCQSLLKKNYSYTYFNFVVDNSYYSK